MGLFSTTEKHGRERKRTELASRPTADKTMRPIIRLSRHSPSRAFCRLHLLMARKAKSAAPRLKSVNGWSVARGDVCGKAVSNANDGYAVPLSLFHPKCGRFRLSRPTTTNADLKSKSVSGREAV